MSKLPDPFREGLARGWKAVNGETGLPSRVECDVVIVGSGAGAGITPQEAVMLINREKALVVDVCEAAEFAQGHINGARNIPLAQLAEGKGLPGKKQQAVVVVCASGARASRAAAQLKAQGYENVRVLGGGMNAWRTANLPVNKTA